MKTDIIVESKHQTIQGLAFPLKDAAKKALQQLAHKRINYIQLVSRPAGQGGGGVAVDQQLSPNKPNELQIGAECFQLSECDRGSF